MGVNMGVGTPLTVTPTNTYIGIVYPLLRGSNPAGTGNDIPIGPTTVYRIVADLTISRQTNEVGGTSMADVWFAILRANYDVNDALVTSGLRDLGTVDNNLTQWPKFVHYRRIQTGANSTSLTGPTLNSHHLDIRQKVLLREDQGLIFAICASTDCANDGFKYFALTARALCRYGRT